MMCNRCSVICLGVKHSGFRGTKQNLTVMIKTIGRPAITVIFSKNKQDHILFRLMWRQLAIFADKLTYTHLSLTCSLGKVPWALSGGFQYPKLQKLGRVKVPKSFCPEFHAACFCNWNVSVLIFSEFSSVLFSYNMSNLRHKLLR